LTVTLSAALLLSAMVFLLAMPHRFLRTRPAGKITAGALTRLWAACGINRVIERAYAAAVIAVTGGWLSGAIAAGPVTKPLPACPKMAGRSACCCCGATR